MAKNKTPQERLEALNKSMAQEASQQDDVIANALSANSDFIPPTTGIEEPGIVSDPLAADPYVKELQAAGLISAKGNDPDLAAAATPVVNVAPRGVAVPRQVPLSAPRVDEATKLRQNIAAQGNRLDATARTQRPEYEPNPDEMRWVWQTAFQSCLKQTFSKGLTYHNQRPDELKKDLQMACVRADEALEAFIHVRSRSPYPGEKAVQDWAKKKLNS